MPLSDTHTLHCITYRKKRLLVSLSLQISTNIITEDEWRSFEVGVDDAGNITLIDKNNMDRLLISHIDSSPIKPLYVILRSNEPSFWKVIES